MKKTKLDKEEQDVVNSFERGEWRRVKNQKREMAKHQRYADNTLRKDRRVNIRISSEDLDRLQVMAVEDGIPYQTLMSSVLHRYESGKLVDATKQTKPPV